MPDRILYVPASVITDPSNPNTWNLPDGWIVGERGETVSAPGGVAYRGAVLGAWSHSVTPQSVTVIDNMPDAFALSPEVDAAVSTEYVRNFIVGGINETVDLSITSPGQYVINGSGPRRSTPGRVSNGDTVSVYLTSSANFQTAVETTVRIGNISGGGTTQSATFRVTTRANVPDYTPNPVAFAPLSNQTPGALVASQEVTPTGYNRPINVSIDGFGATFRVIMPDNSLRGGGYSSAPRQMFPGDRIQLRQLVPGPGQAQLPTVTFNTDTPSGSSAVVAVWSVSATPGMIPNVIFDTDFGNDNDDAVALGLLVDEHRRGNIDLLGVNVTMSAQNAAPAARAFLDHYGLYDVPVWAARSVPSTGNGEAGSDNYASILRAAFGDRYVMADGTSSATGSTLVSASDRSDYPTSEAGYRSVLEAAGDRSVILVTAGFLYGLADFMEDTAGALSGGQLLAAKLSKAVLMGGDNRNSFREETNFTRPTGAVIATDRVLTNWASEVGVPLTIVPFQTGPEAYVGPSAFLSRDASPIGMAFTRHGSFDEPRRDSWDPQAVTIAALDGGDAFFNTSAGTMEVQTSPPGTRWIGGAAGPHDIVSFRSGGQKDFVAFAEERIAALDTSGHFDQGPASTLYLDLTEGSGNVVGDPNDPTMRAVLGGSDLTSDENTPAKKPGWITATGGTGTALDFAGSQALAVPRRRGSDHFARRFFTAAFLIRPTLGQSVNDWISLQYGIKSGWDGWAFGIRNDGGTDRICFRAYNGLTTNPTVTTGTAAVTPGWAIYSISVDLDARSVRVSKDGSVIDTLSVGTVPDMSVFTVAHLMLMSRQRSGEVGGESLVEGRGHGELAGFGWEAASSLADARSREATLVAALSALGETKGVFATMTVTAPSAPTALEAIAGDAEVSLTWQAPANDGGAALSDYELQHSTNGGATWGTLTDGVGTGTSFTAAGLTNGTTGSFRVRALNAEAATVGAGAWSAVATATPTATPVTLAGPVRDLTAAASDAAVALTWDAPADLGSAPLSDYNVNYREAGQQAWSLVTDGVSTSSGAQVSGLTNGTAYEFRVRAITGGVNGGDWSGTVAATPSAPVAGDYDLSGLALHSWIDPTDATTTFGQTDRTGPATSAGDVVRRIDSRTGSNPMLRVSGGDATLLAGGGLSINNMESWVSSPSDLAGVSDVLIAVCLSFAGSSDDQYPVIMLRSAANGGPEGTRWAMRLQSASDPLWGLGDVWVNDAAARGWLDGVDVTSRTSAQIRQAMLDDQPHVIEIQGAFQEAFANRGWGVFAPDSGGWRFDGRFYGLAIHTAASTLTAADRALIRNRLLYQAGATPLT